MICVGGPLDGRLMPDFGTEYFSFTAYDPKRPCGPVHVYRRVGEKWVEDEVASYKATKAGHMRGAA